MNYWVIRKQSLTKNKGKMQLCLEALKLFYPEKFKEIFTYKK